MDDRFDQIDKRFDRVDQGLAELRSEMRTGFAELRQGQLRMSISLWVGVLGLVATILARGA